MGFRDLLYTSPDELLEEVVDQEEIAHRLQALNAELELYRHPLWEYFDNRLKVLEAQALTEMVSGPPENMVLARERVKLVRHLAMIPQNLENERARILASISEGDEE